MQELGEENNLRVEIFSSDKDLLQLVSEKSSVHLIKQGIKVVETVTPSVLKEVYDLYPHQVIEFKGLSGDSSDNIPGVKGVGEVTALKLLNQYDNIENIYKHIDEIKGKLKERLLEDKEMAFTSRRIATICKDVPLDFVIEDLKYNGPTDELIDFYQKYDMNSLIKNLPIKKEEFKFVVKQDLDIEYLKTNICIFPFYEGSNYHRSDLKGIAFFFR